MTNQPLTIRLSTSRPHTRDVPVTVETPMEKVPIVNGMFLPLCKKKSAYCFLGCKLVQPLCDMLFQWVEVHGYENLRPNPEIYYRYWDDFKRAMKMNGVEIPEEVE